MLEKKGLPRIPSIILWVIAPAISFWLLESLTHSVIEDMDWPLICANLIFYYLLYGILLLISKRSWVSISLGSLFVMIIGLVDYYVIQFRSVPLFPWDFLSVKTAMSVSGNFEYDLEKDTLQILLGFLIMILIGLFTRWKLSIKNGQYHLLAVLGAMVSIVLYSTSIQAEAVHKKLGFYDYLFTPNAYYHMNGFAASFISNMQYLKVTKPGNYSAKRAEEMLESYKRYERGQTAETLPNIIVIMNEAFSDPSILGSFQTNVDYMPFIHSLKENTVKGNLFVSVKGGNTANTEYEFLTGASMAFLPMGSVPYQQYIRSHIPTMVSELRIMGYETFSIHPYRANGWNRKKVYEYFGFEKSYFKESFTEAPILREYTTDLATYQKVIDIYNAKPEGQPMFVFDVTMQNHSSYSKDYENFVPDVEVEGTQKDELLEKYLSLIKVSDEALQKLVEYFAEVDEPTVILMFGDHQPADWVVEPVYEINDMDSSALTLEEEQKRYEVPFVLWANYDIEEEYVEAISANYLSSLCLEKAGVPTSPWQNYLSALHEEYPVVTANIFADDKGLYYGSNVMDTMAEELNDYNRLNYYYLFESNHWENELFRALVYP